MGVRWYAFRIEPGKEVLARKELTPDDGEPTRGDLPAMETYLPVFEVKSVRRGAVVVNGRPAVPGYLFGRLELSPRAVSQIINNSRYVLGILPTNNAPTPITDTAIDVMRAECDKLIRMTAEPQDLDWMLGKSFRVEAGPWVDRIGPCIGLAKQDHPVLMLEVFNRLEPVPLPLDCLCLEPVGETQDFVDANKAVRHKYGQLRSRKRRTPPKGQTPGVLLHSDTRSPARGRR